MVIAATNEINEKKGKKLKTDYTGLTKREWTEEKNVPELENGETAIVLRNDGSLSLHFPGEMDDEATFPQEMTMLLAMVVSGTTAAQPIFEQLLQLREQNMELASISEDLPN